MAIKTFTTGEVLTAADTNTYLANSGLVYVAGTTFATTSTPFINGCFSSTYENYRIVMSLTCSSTTNLRMRFRSGTNTPETGSVYDRFGFSYVGSVDSQIISNQTSAYLGDITSVGIPNVFVSSIDIFNPNTALHTNTLPTSWGSNSGSIFLMPVRVETTTAYTGIELFGDAGTLTGSMRVYGYRQA
jgi:hypothetical protein